MKGLEEVVGLKVGDYYCYKGNIKEVTKGMTMFVFSDPKKVMIIQKGCFPTCANSWWGSEPPYFRCCLFDRTNCRCPDYNLFKSKEEKVLEEYKYWLKRRK